MNYGRPLRTGTTGSPTKREVLWFLACLLMVLRISYLFALDDETGRWQAFLTIPWFIALFAGPVVLALVRQIRWPTVLAFELLAVASLWIARGVEPTIRPLARRNDHQEYLRGQASHDALVARHEAELQAVFALPQKVQVVDQAYIILNDGYALEAPHITVTRAEWDQYYAALSAALTGQMVTVTLDPRFRGRYAPSMRSGITDRYRFGRGAAYGQIPASIRLHGQALVGWKDGALVWADR